MTHPIYESLYRPVLFVGVTPGVAVLEASTLFALVFVIGVHVATCLLAVVYLAVIHPLAVWITARDAHILAVYLRSLATTDFYAPHAPPFARTPPVRLAIPRTH
jgi:type IV secretory pathway TrbD component